jgi:hypothetical protein
MNRAVVLLLSFVAPVAIIANPTAAQAQVRLLGIDETSGTIESVTREEVTLKDAAGKVIRAKIQPQGEDAVSLTGGIRLSYPATVQVRGQFPVASLKPGQQVAVTVLLNRLGMATGKVSEIMLVATDGKAPGIYPESQPAAAKDAVPCKVVGEVMRSTGDRLVVKIPPGDFTRKTALALSVEKDAVVQFSSTDHQRAGAGAVIKRALLARLDTGDTLVKEIEIEVASQTTQASRAEEQLALKYRNLSDEPRQPREVRSRHFLLKTDISDRQAQILLDKLETMVTLLSVYFGRQPASLVQGFVVRDLEQWPADAFPEPEGVAKIQEQAGICFGRSLGDQREAVIYCCDDHGVVQHEATHAYANLAFGSAGPTWLAEGVAEMGQYWKVDERAVDISPNVMQYLQQTSPQRTLLEIAVPGRTDSGTWQDYAWRWALCHLLANNPNYADRFKPLAVALMSEHENVSFESVYGPVAKEISFEYDLFLQTLDNGYRADLCAWQWGRKFAVLTGDRRAKATVTSKYGWQASNLRVKAGETYEIAATGAWKIAGGGTEYTADGDDSGRGKLVGTIFRDFKLSEPIELGARARFTAASDGDLYLRCRDEWNRLADNAGDLTVHVRLAPP